MAAILKAPLGSSALSMRGTLSVSPWCLRSVYLGSVSPPQTSLRSLCPCLSRVFWPGEHGVPSAWIWFRITATKGVDSYQGQKMGQIVLEARAINETKWSDHHQKFGGKNCARRVTWFYCLTQVEHRPSGDAHWTYTNADVEIHLAYLSKPWRTAGMFSSLSARPLSPLGRCPSFSSDHHRHQSDAPLHLQPGPRALRPRREAGRLLSGEGGVRGGAARRRSETPGQEPPRLAALADQIH